MWNKTVTVVLIWSLCCGLFSSIHSACDNGWFGSSCQYKCHCTNNNCDDNGICTSGSTCVDGWFGPACQYVNLATSGIFSETSLTDDNDKTCIDNINIQEVTVSFTTNPIPFTWMRIVFKDPNQVQDIQLQFKPQDTDSVINCKNLRNATVTKTSVDIHCDLDVAVDEVILKREGVKSLCSIYISGGRNVALKQKTSQSSTHGKHVSGNAVDGIIITGFEKEDVSCTHTLSSDSNPNLNITFTHPQLVNRYILYNRDVTDCCQERLKGFILQSFTKTGLETFYYQDQEENPQDIYSVLSVEDKHPISRVTIKPTNPTDPDGLVLTVCEVEIFGDSACPNGKYGLDCDQTCNCDKKDETCFVSTGGCPSGCSSGFYGEDCHTECPPAYHGIDCKEKCNTNCLNELCKATSGVCLECVPGMMGDFCQIESLDRFGSRCQYHCPPNCKDGVANKRVCDLLSGTCSQGCKDGYIGLMCNEKCTIEKYGPSCLNDCSVCCNRNFTGRTSVCHHVNGQCLHGCIQGYEGDICTTFVKDDTSGLKIGIGVSCGLLVIAIIAFVVFKLRKFRNSRTERNQEPSVSYNHIDVNQEDVQHYRDL